MTPKPELSVAAIVVADGAVLLVRNARGIATGKWAPPGGRVEFGETIRAAVAREVREETGIDVEVGALAGWVERIGDDPVPHHYVILDFFAVPVGDRTPVAGDDASDARWASLATLASFELVDGVYDFLVEIGSVRE
ncbi:MAG: NUDIX hydrolase [Actinomycetota bacterium]